MTGRIGSRGLFGAFLLAIAAPSLAQDSEPHPAHDVCLLAHLQPFEVGGSSLGRGTKPWSYRSPGGREYAIFGGHLGTAFLDVTDPGAPLVVANIPGPPGSPWRPCRTYQEVAYITSGAGPDFQILDLSQIDDGQVTLVTTIASGVQENTHNLALDEESGFLYRVGLWGVPGLRMYDLTDPFAPELVGVWPDRTQDAQVVTYTDGPYAGRQIAFACTNDPESLSIVDVTDKANPFLVRRVPYPQSSISHQCWLSEDRQWVFLNDEGDTQFGLPSRTVVIDVSSLEDAAYATSFDNGNTAYTHDAFVRGDRLFCANRTSGLRVFDVSDPLAATEIAWYDTWPTDDSPIFYDLKGVTPFFESGIVAGTSAQQGLFLWTVGARPLRFEYPSGKPTLVDPAGGTQVVVAVTESQPGELASPVTLCYRAGETSGEVPCVPTASEFVATLPAFPCGEPVSWFVSARDSRGFTWSDPPAATTRSERHTATAALGTTVHFADDFESDLGWTTTAPASSPAGAWERAVPTRTPLAPGEDHDRSGGTHCYVTDARTSPIPGPGYFEYRVEGGPHRLTSPVIDLAGAIDPRVSYARWFANNGNEFSIDDPFEVEVTSDGVTWTMVETAGLGGSAPCWTRHGFRVLDHVALTSSFQVRFTVSDMLGNSSVEAALDDVVVHDALAPAGVPCVAAADCGLLGVSVQLDSLGYQVEVRLENNSNQDVTLQGGCLVRHALLDDCSGARVFAAPCSSPDVVLPPGGSITDRWLLHDDAGELVPAGSYAIEVAFLDAAGHLHACCSEVVVDSSHVQCTGDGGDQQGCTDCPCGNNAPPGSGGGCLNGSANGALLVPSGVPSLLDDSLHFELERGSPNTFAILLSAPNGLPLFGSCPPGSGIVGAVGLDGLRCIGGGLARHGSRPLDVAGSTTAGWGPPAGPPGGLLSQGGFVSGETRSFQAFYRDAITAGCGTGQNTTQAVRVAFLP